MSAEPEADLELTRERAAELVAAGAELIDVRRTYEWDGGRLAGARNVEMNDLVAAGEDIARDRPVIFYCRSGDRSRMAADAFHEAGYDAHTISGGITAWVAEGRPLEPDDGEVRAPLPAS